MEERLEQPWTRRWWRMPGETLLSQSFDSKQVTVTFAWCSPTEWGVDFVIEGNRPDSAIFHVDSEDITGIEALPKAAVAALMEQFKVRERSIRQAPTLARNPILLAIAEQLPKQEWSTGRRLRKAKGLDVDAFNRQLALLMPRYVRREAIDEDDKYSLTLPGLLLVDDQLRSIAIMESVYHAIGRCYDRDEDAEVFENADIVACGVADSDVPLARTIARICVLVGGGAALNDRVLRIPADREMIAAQVKKKVSFLDYLHHAATEKQRNPHFAVNRPWLQAPIWIERDGSQPDYLPIGFLAPMLPSKRFVAGAPLAQLELSEDEVEDADEPESRLPRLDVTYGKKLGDGAFGTVWEATDALLERRLAVKFLTTTAEFLNEDALLMQARSLAKVAHPNLVVVYGAAWLRHPATGLVAPAIMMELLDGEPLLPWSGVQHDRESALRVAAGLFSGIAAMHAAGLHHGDLHARNVIVLADGDAKVIDWRYQDTFLARSTASRNELIEADARHAIDLVVSMFEKQGLRDEALDLRRMSIIGDAQALIGRLTAPPPPTQAPSPATVEAVSTAFPPAPVQLDRVAVKENEKTEEQSELAIWPVQDSDLDAGELMAEVDSFVRGGIASAPISMLFRNAPVKSGDARRWPQSHRSYDNVIQKWELEIRDRGFLAFRWAKFSTHEHLRYETRELLDAIVVPLHLYELATAAAAKRAGGPAVARANLRLTVIASSSLILDDDARVTTKTSYSPKADTRFQTQLQAQVPGAPGATAARLINRLLSEFHVERDRFADRGDAPAIVRLDPSAYQKYVDSLRLDTVTP
jgi:hypothetical protein